MTGNFNCVKWLGSGCKLGQISGSGSKYNVPVPVYFWIHKKTTGTWDNVQRMAGARQGGIEVGHLLKDLNVHHILGEQRVGEALGHI